MEFVTAEFKLNLTLVQLFIWLVSTKNKLNTKNYTVFRVKVKGHVHMKMQWTFIEDKFLREETTLNKQTNTSGYFSVAI